MKIQNSDISRIIPYEFNNRKHGEEQVNRIANSISEFGFNQPIVIDESNIILVGHGRHLAALKLGLKEVPVLIKSGLSEMQKKAYRILDNKLQNDSTWSFDNLELELGFLEDNGFELEPWGLGDLLGMFNIDPEIEDDEFNPDECENEETFIKLGDLIELGAHRVMCGDSTSAEDVSRLLGAAEPFVMVTDPPYGVDLDQSWRDESLGSKALGRGKANIVENDDRADWADAWKLFPGDIAYVWHADRFSDVVMQSLRHSQFEICQQLIWNKSVMVMGRSDYHFKHEPCWYAVRKNKTHGWSGDRTQTTVIEAKSPNHIMAGSTEEKTAHPTQKPVECMAYLLKNHNGDAYDPFLGSGTTLIAADQLNRICYGMEISPKYCHVIIERYKKHCEKVGKPFKCTINGEPFNGAPN